MAVLRLQLFAKTLRCDVTGVDINADVVRYAEKRYTPNNSKLRYLHGNAQELTQFADASIDALISVETIEHVPDAEKALAAYKRVLKPNGVLYITSPDSTDRPGTLSTAFHVQEWTYDDFVALLKRSSVMSRCSVPDIISSRTVALSGIAPAV